jgi:competence protein ComEA
MKKVLLSLLLAAVAMFAKVDINSADARALTVLKGVGEAKAKQIVEYRGKNGAFKSVDDLMKVPGIGKKILDDNKNELEVKAPIGAPATKPVEAKKEEKPKK